ncbi:MAG TPA: hypothetical protein VFT66_05895, partial [Roseiflexaceae bacterium]|nr:hypothetical protein [Roseiflexaceae bacterium]
MTLSIFVPTALQLYEYGLNRIFNSHWVDFNMKHMINLHRSGKLHPTGLLQKTLPNGILYHLGLWLFNEYFLENLDFFIDLEPKEIYTYLQHHLYLLGKGGCDVTSQEFLDLIMLIDDINDIGFDKPYS